MKRLVIAVDCDDVIVETSNAILKYYHETYGVKVPPELLYTATPAQWGVKHDDEAIKRVYQYLATEESQALPPISEAVKALSQLKDTHEIHLVTGRADFMQPSTLAWLDRYFSGVFDSTEFTNYIVPTEDRHVSRSKADVCKQLQADILIEDHPHHAELVAATGTQVLLYGDLPWNRGAKLPAQGITRVKDWDEILTFVDNFVTQHHGS